MTTTTERPMSALETAVGEAKKKFDVDAINHRLHVVHDDGVHRHLRFSDRRSSFYWFEIITWPGGLTIGGDVEWWTFRRDADMLAFFRSSPDRRHPGLWGTSPDYWAEKLVTGRDSAKVYDEDLFKTNVREHTDQAIAWGDLDPDDDTKEIARFRRQVAEELLEDPDTYHEDNARRLVDDFLFLYGPRHPVTKEQKTFRFEEAYEWTWHGYSTHFLWACHALVWAIDQYDASRAPSDVPIAPVLTEGAS